MIDCNETLTRLYGYLDRELSATELAEVKEHLEHCPPCNKHFKFEAGVIRYIGDTCRGETAPESLTSRVKKLCASQTTTESLH